MKKNTTQKRSKKRFVNTIVVLFLLFVIKVNAQVTFEKEVKISDIALHFDGSQVESNAPNTGENAPYDYYFGNQISAHGDCVTSYNEYVFVSWFKGGKENRQVMLSRYNTLTGTVATIEFPHRHTGFQNKWWIGESHNTIAVAVSPLNGTIHMLYDMHSYSDNRPSDGSLSNDYFRYSFSVANAASVSDADFTLSQFVNDPDGEYKHLSLNQVEDYAAFSALTYPQFFLNDSGVLFMYIREGGNNNGAYKFTKYNAGTSTWAPFTQFNILNAKSQGEAFNWGLYGSMKYINGKIRVGFQRRLSNNNDKYLYQNGVYYAYSDDQNGLTGWKNYQGTPFSLPLIDADKALVMEPGDLVATTAANEVYIVQGFDWTVTDNGDVHIISQVKDNENNVTKNVHTYQKAGETEFTTSTDFAGAEAIYTSGSDVYIIGLDQGRVYVEKAKGGTNNFTRVYKANSGRIFNHGEVHINNGKLYYYLMERKTGSAQPVYIQVIDLGIAQTPFNVSLNAPMDNEIFNTDEIIQFSADANIVTGTITKVEFWIDNQLVSQDTTAPYTGSWETEMPGNHIIKAIAYASNNETVSSKEINVVVNLKNYLDLSGNIYRLKNVATGKYMQSNNTTVIASNEALGQDKEWEFVKSGSGDFFNIDSNTSRGILRFHNSSQITNTGFAPPNTNTDKIWIIVYDAVNKQYSFKAGSSNSYLYNNTDDTIIYSANTDDRSKWIVESTTTTTTTTLSLNDKQVVDASVNVYPNPANNKFNIAFKGFIKATIEIYDVLGKTLYKSSTTSNTIQINSDGKFKPGIYFLKVIDEKQRVYKNKLVIK